MNKQKKRQLVIDNFFNGEMGDRNERGVQLSGGENAKHSGTATFRLLTQNEPAELRVFFFFFESAVDHHASINSVRGRSLSVRPTKHEMQVCTVSCWP